MTKNFVYFHIFVLQSLYEFIFKKIFLSIKKIPKFDVFRCNLAHKLNILTEYLRSSSSKNCFCKYISLNSCINLIYD